MILDGQLMFSNNQVLSGAGAAASTNVIDLGPGATRQIAPGTQIYIVLNVKAAMTGTSGTLVVAVQSDDNAAFSSAATQFTSATYLQANLPLSTQIVLPIPMVNEQFMRLNYTLGGTTPAVTIDAHLVLTPQYDIKYPTNIVVN